MVTDGLVDWSWQVGEVGKAEKAEGAQFFAKDWRKH